MGRLLADLFFGFVVKFTITIVLIAILGVPVLNMIKTNLNPVGVNITTQDFLNPVSRLEKELNNIIGDY